MQKVDRLRLKLDKAAKRHAVWAVARPTGTIGGRCTTSRASLSLLVAGDFGDGACPTSTCVRPWVRGCRDGSAQSDAREGERDA